MLSAQATPKAFLFDAVSIKPNTSGSGNISISMTGDRYLCTNNTLKGLLMYAYDLKTEEAISGLPKWADSASYDIDAKMDAETVAALKKMTRPESSEQKRLMMQGVLADRFGLKLHHETRDLPIYALVVAKGGPKLQASASIEPEPAGEKRPEGSPRGSGSMSIHNGDMTATGIPLSNLAANLSMQLHREVRDRTGLTGNYDFKLSWSREELDGRPQDAAASGAAPAAPSIFTALQEQLGLKLDSTKGPVDTIVVDHIDPPTEN